MNRTVQKRGKAESRTNDPERTMADIIEVATREFAEKGLAGARIDVIAEAMRTSKRMIYYYFGSKEGLYIAVLEEAYRRIRAIEADLHLEDLTPEDALRKLVGFTVDYQRANGVTTREQYLGRYEPNFNVSDNFYVYALAQYERDRFQGIAARYAVSGGMGYQALKADDIQLSVKAGPAYRVTEFADGRNESRIAGLIGLVAYAVGNLVTATAEGVIATPLPLFLVDGEGAGALGKTRLRAVEEIPALIQKFKDAGCAQVKIYSSLNPKLIAPLAQAAHQAGLTVTGHVPEGIGAVHAVQAGMDQINHMQFVIRAFVAPEVDPDKSLEGPAAARAFDALDPTTPAAKKLAAWFAAQRTVLDPTMALRELNADSHAELVRKEPGLSKLPPTIAAALADVGARPEDLDKARARFAKALALLKLLHQAGVPIVAGTDQTVPGHSIHRELELYVQAGFTPLEALQAATLIPARVMNRDKELGTIEVGKRADFVVVDGDPLADIRALRRVGLVVAGGMAYDPAKLWQSVGFKP